MKKVILIFLIAIVLSGCTVVRIDTSDIDTITNVVLSKKNKLYNQVGQGYKYYLPGGVTYIDSDELNDILYCNGNYYYLYIDAINYYYKKDISYVENKNLYYSRNFNIDDGFNHNGYLQIKEVDGLYHIEFVYNYAKIEAIVEKKDINDTILNSSYILSTIKYNYNIVELMLNKDYFINKTGKYNDFETDGNSGKFEIKKENEMKEG